MVKRGSQRRMLQLAARTFYPVSDDPLMIERQPQASSQHITGPRPARARGIGAGYRVRQPWHDRQVGDGYHPPAGITSRVAVHAGLFQMQRASIQPGLFGEFTAGRAQDGFCLVTQEAARQRHHPRMRLDAAPDQQHVQARVPEGQDHQVDGQENAGRLLFLVGHLSIVTFRQPDRKYPGGYFWVASQ
jgi:hypothetical protein